MGERRKEVLSMKWLKKKQKGEKTAST
jgi:hypothetical protein